jgi:hypothetical protein
VIAAKLVELIEIHSPRLTADIVDDLASNERTPGFRAVRRSELERRVFQLLHHLGNWIGDPRSDNTRVEFTDWGRRRFDQGIPLSELIFAVIVIKQHLRRYISDNGLVSASFPRVDGDYVLPLHLHSLQDLNTQVGRFFDEALYDLALGYEERARMSASIGAVPADPPRDRMPR